MLFILQLRISTVISQTVLFGIGCIIDRHVIFMRLAGDSHYVREVGVIRSTWIVHQRYLKLLSYSGFTIQFTQITEITSEFLVVVGRRIFGYTMMSFCCFELLTLFEVNVGPSANG